MNEPLPLYQFQQEDVDRLTQMPSLADASEMGTGKTLKGVAYDLAFRSAADSNIQKPVTLVVAPLNVGPTWVRWFKRQAPHLRIGRLDPKNRGPFIQSIRRRTLDVYIMHWDALRLMPELREVAFFHIIADEAHRASNRKAQQTRALKGLRTIHKTALSGTLSGNKPPGLWSPLNWLYPKEFRSYWSFYNTYTDFEIVYPAGYHKFKGPKNLEQLHETIGPIYTRHMKKEQCCVHHPEGVMPWLPDKYYSQVWVDLAPKQRRIYDQMRKNQLAWVGEHEDSPIMASVVVAQMVRLQQFAVANADVIDDRVVLSDPSSKLDALMEIIDDNPDKQFVVFSQFKQLVNLAAARLDKAGVTNVVLSGDTPQAVRNTLEDDFEAGKYRVFVGVIAAGGVGLTLTAADTVIFLDRSWSPMDNAQAEDRLHRDGQKSNAVHVIDIMARNTIDLGRHQDLKRKWSWIKALLGDKVQQTALAEEAA